MSSSSSSNHRLSPPVSPSPSPNIPPHSMALRLANPHQHQQHHQPQIMHPQQHIHHHHTQYPNYPPPNLPVSHSHQPPQTDHSYPQSFNDMSHPYTQYPSLPPPHVPARNGGIGSSANPPTNNNANSNRKRKKADSPDEQQQQPPARRLRRLHEACTRCRTKKIKCDSKLPSCSACTSAHVECNQEDRHRQTLKPRGYTDRLETSLVKCIFVLQRLVPGFEDHPDVDGLFERHGLSLVDVDPNVVIAGVLAAASGAGPGSNTAMKQEPHPNPLSIAVDTNQNAIAGPSSSTITSHSHSVSISNAHHQDRQPYRQHSGQQQHAHEPQSQSPVVPIQPGSGTETVRSSTSSAPLATGISSSPANEDGTGDVKGQDPHSNDLSGLPGLIKAFGVSKHIVRDLPRPDANEGEDVLGGVRMEDDELVPTYPKTFSQWTAGSLARRPNAPSPATATAPHVLGPAPHSPSHKFKQNPRKFAFRLPKDRRLTERVVKKYFDSLNPHRPVFIVEEFNWGLKMLYDSLEGSTSTSSATPSSTSTSPSTPMWGPHLGPLASVSKHPDDDPGFLCSVYLILALGRLSEDNDHLHECKTGSPEALKDFPTHEEFFELALAVKPDLRVTISSLQALILLQWYLYTERHFRTLWRLVGNLVRLSIELGLHHDPTEQGATFTPAEAEVRNRLWWTVMIHDRGTSVTLGRPLAIADQDFNTPLPRRYPSGFSPQVTSSFTEHFEHSPHLTAIQGDIINALYRPGNHKQTADQIVRHASRITKGFGGFWRGILGERYRKFFEGCEALSVEKRIEVVTSMNEDQGLTLLKYGIARILMLRALFTNSIIGPDARRRALKDAVITSHNILTIQMQLTCFPSLAFFVSPTPIHIAAMVIIYGIISKCDALPYAQAREDVCSALHIVPLFRWRWNRKDLHGSHPLIVSLAKKVFGADVLDVQGPLGPPMLISEWDWTTGMTGEPSGALLSPSREGVGMGGPHRVPVVANGYHHDQTSPASAGSGGHWDHQGQHVPHGPPSRQNSGMIHNGEMVGRSPQTSHAGHPSRDPYGGPSNHPSHHGGPASHDSGQHVQYSPPSDGTPPSYQINDADKNWMEALLYPPPLTTEQHLQGMSSGGMGVGIEANGMSSSGGQMAMQHQGQQTLLQSANGPGGPNTSYDMQQQQAHQMHHQRSTQQLPQHHVSTHDGHHAAAVQSSQPNHGAVYPAGGVQQVPVHQSASIMSDYSQSASHYLQEEFDQSMPVEVMPIPPPSRWTS